MLTFAGVDPELRPKKFLEQLEFEAAHLSIAKVVKPVLSDPRLILWAGAAKPSLHHYGKGRLIEHIYEVAHICRTNATLFAGSPKEVDYKALFIAAIYHDVGKLWDYEPVPDTDYKEWQVTDHKNAIHHVSRSGQFWMEQSAKIGYTENRDHIWHMILSHHGLKDWGSPVQPQTREAWLLHLSDCISARMDDMNSSRLNNR